VADAASRIVRLREERSGADSRFLDAYLDGEGNLHVDGQDLGPATSIVSGDGEYEWFETIKARHLPQLVQALGGEPSQDILGLLEERFTGKGSYDFERILQASGIPVELFVY